MKILKIIFSVALLATVFSSCYVEETVVVADPYVAPEPSITLNQLLQTYELWYVDINRSNASGQIPFMQIAFTLSFRNGEVLANNNLVGIGDQGYGYGIPIGYYDAYDFILDISHDIDGFVTFDVTQLNDSEIELYNPANGLRYVLVGYQRSTFDYDLLFYENIHYFVQEYFTWEKLSTEGGAPNEFDNEHFLQFLPGSGDGNFQSSQDPVGSDINNLFWDYTGIYNVEDVPGNRYLKYLTLDYDYLGNEYFELNVINDNTIELFHETSGTTYTFGGRGYIQYKESRGKLRIPKAAIDKQIASM
ncbi:MAG: nicotinic acid mononucleotide adenyltransferase [Flavobacteriaceae bacterium]|nr:nicotinic acid mononucleotide adenyltransferase [Flavobacteriaceae bacterium]